MKEILKSTCVLLVISLVAGFLLGFFNNLTKEPIAMRTEVAKESSLNSVIDSEFSINIEKDITDQVSVDKDGVIIEEVYEFVDESGAFSGIVALVTSTKGYKDDIRLSVGVEMISKNTKAGEICGMDFLSINETPGLGMNVKDEDFINQFIGKTVELEVSKNSVHDNQIDTVSGATITSEAVTDAVNAVMSFYNQYVGLEEN